MELKLNKIPILSEENWNLFMEVLSNKIKSRLDWLYAKISPVQGIEDPNNVILNLYDILNQCNFDIYSINSLYKICSLLSVPTQDIAIEYFNPSEAIRVAGEATIVDTSPLTIKTKFNLLPYTRYTEDKISLSGVSFRVLSVRGNVAVLEEPTSHPSFAVGEVKTCFFTRSSVYEPERKIKSISIPDKYPLLKKWFESSQPTITNPLYMDYNLALPNVVEVLFDGTYLKTYGNDSWEIIQYPDWCSVTPLYGKAPDNIFIRLLPPNQSLTQGRTGTIKVKSAHGLTREVTIVENLNINVSCDLSNKPFVGRKTTQIKVNAPYVRWNLYVQAESYSWILLDGKEITQKQLEGSRTLNLELRELPHQSGMLSRTARIGIAPLFDGSKMTVITLIQESKPEFIVNPSYAIETSQPSVDSSLSITTDDNTAWRIKSLSVQSSDKMELLIDGFGGINGTEANLKGVTRSVTNALSFHYSKRPETASYVWPATTDLQHIIKMYTRMTVLSDANRYFKQVPVHMLGGIGSADLKPVVVKDGYYISDNLVELSKIDSLSLEIEYGRVDKNFVEWHYDIEQTFAKHLSGNLAEGLRLPFDETESIILITSPDRVGIVLDNEYKTLYDIKYDIGIANGTIQAGDNPNKFIGLEIPPRLSDGALTASIRSGETVSMSFEVAYKSKTLLKVTFTTSLKMKLVTDIEISYANGETNSINTVVYKKGVKNCRYLNSEIVTFKPVVRGWL